MTIEPSYFSANGHDLLGIYHPPGPSVGGQAVLLCPPVFGEYLRSHGALRRIAQAVAARGAHAMRFDYRGTGDSSGSFENATTQQWLDDLLAAVEELRAISGARRVRLVGVRLGATLAAQASLLDSSIDRVVLWDPVLDGASYAAELADTHRRLLEAHVSPRAPDSPLPDSGELLGYPVSSELLESIKSLKLPDWTELAERQSCQCVVVNSHQQLEANKPPESIECRSNALDCNWNTFKESILLPGGLVADITDAVL